MFKDLPTTFQGLHSIFKDHLLCGNSGGVGEEVGGGSSVPYKYGKSKEVGGFS